MADQGDHTHNHNGGDGSHEHRESHSHSHSHHHSHSHSHPDPDPNGQHSHHNQHKHDMTGPSYWRWPGVRETGLKTAMTVLKALAESGLSDNTIQHLNMLDVGCGGGLVTHHLAPHVGLIHAIDTEPSILESFASRLPSSLGNARTRNDEPKITHSLLSLSRSTKAVLESKTRLPSPCPGDQSRVMVPPRSQWDAAMVVNVLHHVQDVPDFMVGLRDVLVDGGVVVIIEPGKLVPSTGTHKVIEQEEGHSDIPYDGEELLKRMQHGQAHSHFVSPDQIKDILLHNGFEDVHLGTNGTMPIFGVGKDELECKVVWARKSS